MENILIITNALGGMYNFRKELVERLVKDGYKVFIAAPLNHKSFITLYFQELGIDLVNVSFNRKGFNPFSDLSLMLSYRNLIKKRNIDAVLTYTIKPNIYGGLAARMMKVPFIPNITGLGTAVENKGLLQKITVFLYRRALKKAQCVFFQNEENLTFMQDKGIVKDNVKLLPGSGVNLEHFTPLPYPPGETLHFLFIGRLMKDKGIEEYLDAIKRIKKSYPSVEFHILGGYEDTHYAQRVEAMENQALLNYHGRVEDVVPYLKQAHAVVHPTYHEGMSNVLLEASASARPVIASNIPGCKETFDEGVSGFGFEPKNSDALIKTIEKFMNLPYEQKRKMGLKSREKMEQTFDRNIVVEEYLKTINTLKGR